MDTERFDGFARSLSTIRSRRAVLAALIADGAAIAAALLGLGEAAAAGCLKNGKACKRGKQCCSGVCKKGTCRRAREQGTCTTQLNICLQSSGVSCNGNDNCVCAVTRNGASFCGSFLSFSCSACETDADCMDVGGAESICIDAVQANCNCASFGGRACIAPCPNPAP